VVEVEVDGDARRTTAVCAQMPDGRRVRFVADHYVLACGGIENARLLLASNRVATAGVGNAHDLVGRFYADHPYCFTGYFEPASSEYDRTLHVIEDFATVGEQGAVVAFGIPERTRRDEGLNDCVAYFVRRPAFKTVPTYYSPGVRAMTQLVDVLRGLDLPDEAMGQRFAAVARRLPDVGVSIARQVIARFRPRQRLAIRTTIETTPNRDSRVTLGRDHDAYGTPRVRLDWRLSDEDRRGLLKLHQLLEAESARTGVGRLVVNTPTDVRGWPASLQSGMHHSGTTRMHVIPREGVVDADCRVHGMANLYVAGSSVFPTFGAANPTFTIVALALRLADHIKRQGPLDR
jgi:choline dehydrogenase-like flavoprotein